MTDDRKFNDDFNTGLLTEKKPKTKKPSLYKVLMLNDDYTPMEFVIEVLEKYFNKKRGSNTNHVTCSSKRYWDVWYLYI